MRDGLQPFIEDMRKVSTFFVIITLTLACAICLRRMMRLTRPAYQFRPMRSRVHHLKYPRLIPDQFLGLLRQSLQSISEDVFYRDERGFQGALVHELSMRLRSGVLPEDPVIQQEYQKRLRHHSIKIRPDIILHVPFERGYAEGRDKGNFVAIELKRRATAKRAKAAFANLALMKKALKYPLTVFVNIDSKQTHAALCPRSIADQTLCFAVRLENGEPVVRAETRDRRTIETGT